MPKFEPLNQQELRKIAPELFTFKCGHPRTPENTVKKINPTCRICNKRAFHVWYHVNARDLSEWEAEELWYEFQKRDAARAALAKKLKSESSAFKCGHLKTEDNIAFNITPAGNKVPRCRYCYRRRSYYFWLRKKGVPENELETKWLEKENGKASEA